MAEVPEQGPVRVRVTYPDKSSAEFTAARVEEGMQVLDEPATDEVGRWLPATYHQSPADAKSAPKSKES